MEMRSILTVLLVFCAGILCAGQHICEVSGPVKDAGALEIVTEQPVPVVDFAAKELQTYLKQATGQTVPIVPKASGSKTALVLGDCPSAKNAGLDVNKLPEEGFRILRKGNCVFIAGRDDPKNNPANLTYRQNYRRATLSGVYDFLERFADARFFFPGKYGTVVPAKKGLSLPEKINVIEDPDMSVRAFYPGKAKPYSKDFTITQFHALENLRLRLSENNISISHGLSKLNLIERFSKTHPEYFAMMADGTRYFQRKNAKHRTQLCYSSGVREVIYQDVKAYFTGQPASSRGMKAWTAGMKDRFSLNPDDGMYWCRCEKCRKICGPGQQTTPEGRQAISNFMFRFTAEIANRLIKEGIKGYLKQSVYSPYNMVPDCKIPPNVVLSISANGTVDETRKDDDQRIRAWHAATGLRLAAWVYAMGKHMNKVIPDLPQMMPREAAKFITTYRKELAGVFWEAQSDRYIFNYLNYYVAAKMMWNNSLDLEKLLDDHYRSMFGKGGPMVKEVFDELEKCWIKGINNHTVMDALGPRVQIPGDREIWTKIYSAEKLARFGKLFDEAQRAAADDPGALERLKFIREQMIGPLLAAQKKYSSTQNALDSWRVDCPGTVFLRPSKGDVNEVNTQVDITREGDTLVVRFDCEEPQMDKLAAKYTGRDNPDTWRDSDVEIFINPSGDRKKYYHFVVNANGALTDYRREVNIKKADIGWNSSATVKTEKGAAGWKAEVRIPLKDLGPLAKEIPVNFARCRVLTGGPKETSYQWNPQLGARPAKFHEVEQWGVLSFTPDTRKYLLKFDRPGKKMPYCWRSAGPNGGQVYEADSRIFITGGKSLHIKNVPGKKVGIVLPLPDIKPNTRYQIAYFIKTKDIQGKGGARAQLLLNKKPATLLPKVALTGTNPWHRLTFEVTTPEDTGVGRKPSLNLGLHIAGGEAWFDQIEVIELGK